MFLTRCHNFPFPATRGHLPRGATFAPNRRWPLGAGTTVLLIKITNNYMQGQSFAGAASLSFRYGEFMNMANGYVCMLTEVKYFVC